MTDEELLIYFGGQGLVPSGKHDVILEYAKRFRCTTFIETGTENGDTIEAVRPAFTELYSIESVQTTISARLGVLPAIRTSI